MRVLERFWVWALAELAQLLSGAQEISHQAACYSFESIGKPAREGELLRGQATGKDRGCARRAEVTPTRGIVCRRISRFRERKTSMKRIPVFHGFWEKCKYARTISGPTRKQCAVRVNLRSVSTIRTGCRACARRIRELLFSGFEPRLLCGFRRHAYIIFVLAYLS